MGLNLLLSRRKLCVCAGITIVFFCRFIPTIDRFPCQSLPTNLGPLIPFLVKTQRMTMDSLFQVCAGEGIPTCLLQPIQVDVWKCYRWFEGKAPHGWLSYSFASSWSVLVTQALGPIPWTCWERIKILLTSWAMAL